MTPRRLSARCRTFWLFEHTRTRRSRSTIAITCSRLITPRCWLVTTCPKRSAHTKNTSVIWCPFLFLLRCNLRVTGHSGITSCRPQIGHSKPSILLFSYAELGPSWNPCARSPKRTLKPPKRCRSRRDLWNPQASAAMCSSFLPVVLGAKKPISTITITIAVATRANMIPAP